MLIIKLFTGSGLDAHRRVQLKNDGMAGLGIVEALRHEAGLAFHAGGKKRHILVLALAFFNDGTFDRVAAVGQEAFVLTLVNGYLRNVKFVRICDLNTLA